MTTNAMAQSETSDIERHYNRRINWNKVGHYALLIVLTIIILAPIYVIVMTSLKRNILVLSKEPIWIFTPTISNYQQALDRADFLRHFISSIFVALVSTFLTITVSTYCAYAIARMRFPGRGLLGQTTLLVRMVPPVVLTVPAVALWQRWELLWFESQWHLNYLEWIGQSALCSADGDFMDALCQIFADGISDGRLGLILFYSALNLPFVIWLLIGFIQQIPVDLEEAAIVDGASPFQLFRQIISPLLRGGYAVAAIFTFRIAWNELILGLTLTNRRTYTLPVKLYNLVDPDNMQWGLIMAMGTLILVPPLLLTFFFARQIISGMTAGAVKG